MVQQPVCPQALNSYYSLSTEITAGFDQSIKSVTGRLQKERRENRRLDTLWMTVLMTLAGSPQAGSLRRNITWI